MNKSVSTVIDKFCAFEQKNPHRLFLAEPVKGVYRNFTWQEAGDQMRRMAAALQSMGLGTGDKVAILSKNCAHWVMADLAIAMAGCICIPLYPNVTHEALREVIDHSESKAVFIGKLDNPHELRKGIPESVTCISFPFYPNEDCINWDELIAQHEPIQGKPSIDPHSLACIVYTSGTTGQPKGVMHTFHAMGFAVEAFLDSFPGVKQETFFSYLPLCHVAERMLVEYGTIFTGGSVYFVESMETFAKNLADTQPTVFLAVPRIWEKIQEGLLKKMPQKKLDRLLSIPVVSFVIKRTIKKKLGLGKAKFIFTGASPINPSLLRWYERIGMTIQEAYGMTENVALSHANRSGAVRFGTVGQPYDGVEVRLGKDNEVQVKSAASMLGYYKEPELSAACFDEGFLRTGDEGLIDAQGYLTITGRIKDQFKTSKGKYIMPARLEGPILENLLIAQVCVVGSGMPGAMALCNLAASAQMEDRGTLTAELKKLLASVNKKLEQHEHISKIIILPEEWTTANGLLTPTLKIKRKMIDAAFGARYEEWSKDAEAVIFA
jgi:long-chain acyl-CoA synthetase